MATGNPHAIDIVPFYIDLQNPGRKGIDKRQVIRTVGFMNSKQTRRQLESFHYPRDFRRDVDIEAGIWNRRWYEKLSPCLRHPMLEKNAKGG